MQSNQLFLIPVLSCWCPLFLTASLQIRETTQVKVLPDHPNIQKRKTDSPYVYLKYFPPSWFLLSFLFSPLVYSLMAIVTSPRVSDTVFMVQLLTKLNFSFSALVLIPSIFIHVYSPSKCKLLTVKPRCLPFGLFCIICHCGQLCFLVSVLWSGLSSSTTLDLVSLNLVISFFYNQDQSFSTAISSLNTSFIFCPFDNKFL